MLIAAASRVSAYLDIVEERYASLRGILGFDEEEFVFLDLIYHLLEHIQTLYKSNEIEDYI